MRSLPATEVSRNNRDADKKGEINVADGGLTACPATEAACRWSVRQSRDEIDALSQHKDSNGAKVSAGIVYIQERQ